MNAERDGRWWSRLTSAGRVCFVCLALLLRQGLAVAGPSQSPTDEKAAWWAAQIAQAYKEAALHRANGDYEAAEAVRQQAELLSQKALGRLQALAEGKRRGAAAAEQISREETVLALKHAYYAGKSGAQAFKNLGAFAVACDPHVGGTPITCALALSKAKKGLDAMEKYGEHYIEGRVHAQNRRYADQVGDRLEGKAADLDRQAGSLTDQARLGEFESRLDYTEAVSKPTELPEDQRLTPGSSAGGKELDSTGPRMEGEFGVDPALYDLVRDESERMGVGIEATNDAYPQAPRMDDLDHQQGFEHGAEETRRRVEGSVESLNAEARALERDRAGRAERLARRQHEERLAEIRAQLSERLASIHVDATRNDGRSRDAGGRRGQATQPGKRPSDGGPEESKEDHCATGTFVCPNGLPWPSCTHDEKYQCPPDEYGNEARKYLEDRRGSNNGPKNE